MSMSADHIHKFITEDPVNQTLPIDMRSLSDSHLPDDCDDLAKICVTKLAQIKVTKEERIYAEAITRKQSSDDTWHMLRCGRVTASKAYSVLHTDMSNPSLTVMRSLTQVHQPFRSIYTQWGKDNENTALNIYENIFVNTVMKCQAPQEIHLQGFSQGHDNISAGKTHDMPSVRKCGIYIDTVKPYIAASPDGIFTCRCHEPVLIEVKCLWSMKEKSVEEYVHTGKGKKCIKPDLTINRNHEFYTQIQLQLYVTGFREAHLVLWSPREILITVVNRGEVFIVSMVEKLDAFFQHVILPELITRRLETDITVQRHKPKMITTQQLGVEDLLQICVCGKASTETMVCCDHCDQWYHYSCVGRKHFSKKGSLFYCPNCKIKSNQKLEVAYILLILCILLFINSK